jgi:C-terminal peptidase prc
MIGQTISRYRVIEKLGGSGTDTLKRRVSVVLTLIFIPALLYSQKVDVNFERGRAKDILNVVSKRIQKDFYDPDFHGLPWQQLVSDTGARIDRAQTASEMYTAIFALVDKLQDSHTFFVPPRHVNTSRFGFKAMPIGEEIRIYEFEDDSPAKAAGLQLGDQILAINGFGTRRVSFDNMTLFFRLLRPVTAMDITYRRGNEPEKTMHLEGKIKQGTQVTTWYDFIRQDQADADKLPEVKWADYGDGVGYFKLRSFVPNPNWLSEALGKVKDSKALVLDLRGNPGGTIDSLKYVAGCFSTHSWVLANSNSRKNSEPIKIEPKSPRFSGPLIVLIDSESASAAEAFARSMQLTNRGQVIGDRSFGRLTVANYFPEMVGTDVVVPFAIQVAVARFVFPNGEEIEGKGVIPDQLCIPTEQNIREGRDPCRDQALALARKELQLPEVPDPKPTKEGKVTW